MYLYFIFFLQELAKTEQGNFLVCPFSVETVLALTGVGAKEDTASEIYRSVSLPEDPSQVQGIYKELLPSFRGNNYYNLSTANKVYIQKDFAVLDSFKQTAVDVFGSEVENTDFAVSIVEKCYAKRIFRILTKIVLILSVRNFQKVTLEIMLHNLNKQNCAE